MEQEKQTGCTEHIPGGRLDSVDIFEWPERFIIATKFRTEDEKGAIMWSAQPK